VSLYVHFLEAPVRLERRTNDFSQWLQWRGEVALADEVDRLDPYVVTLDVRWWRAVIAFREVGDKAEYLNEAHKKDSHRGRLSRQTDLP